MRQYKLPNGTTTPAASEIIDAAKPEYYQSVVITLDDGSKHTFTGRVCTFKGDKRRIADIAFTEPKPLPADCHFQKGNLT